MVLSEGRNELVSGNGFDFKCSKCGELTAFGWRELAVEHVVRRLGGYAQGLTGAGWKCKKCGQMQLIFGTPQDWREASDRLADEIIGLIASAEPVPRDTKTKNTKAT